MKKNLLALMSIVGLSFISQATVLTVSNNVNSPGQYTDLQTACNAAMANDTIYVHGSPTSYGTVDITKPLTLIGAGASPNKNFYLRSEIQFVNIKFNTTNTQSGSGSKIIGFYIQQSIYLYENSANTVSVGNVIIERNVVSSISAFGNRNTSNGHSGTIIRNNIIRGGVSFGRVYNVLITNNIIREITLGSSNGSTCTVSNNLIGFGASTNPCVKGYYTTYTNNIFYTPLFATTFISSSVNAPTSYCSFSNNLFLSASTLTNSNIIFGTNAGGGNLLNVDPLFVNQGDGNIENVFNAQYGNSTYYNYNFNLQPGSPCIGAGTDGTDIGIYGGASPFFEGDTYLGINGKHQRYFPMPNLPTVLDMNILNTSVLPNGTLNVEFKARKQD